MDRAAIVAEARTWLGTPFSHQASLRGVGTDCVGLVFGVARSLGLPDAARFAASARYTGYSRQPDGRTLVSGCAEFLDPIPLNTVQPGDILLLHFGHDPMHLSLVTETDPLRVIHALGVTTHNVAEHRIDATWHARIARAYRFRGID